MSLKFKDTKKKFWVIGFRVLSKMRDKDYIPNWLIVLLDNLRYGLFWPFD